jgi:hypothetical protein
MKRDSSECVELDTACKVLVKSRAVQSLVKKSVGAARFQEALILMKAGNLEGDLGNKIHDLLSDSISTEAQEVWSGLIRLPHDDYLVQVNEFHGVFCVWTTEYDPVGYFLDQDSAVSYARSTWDVSEGADEPDDEDEDEDDEIRCPYCDSMNSCDHLLLVVDTTFRHAGGGLIYEAFNERWSAILTEQGEDADEREFFDELLYEVNRLADAELTSSPESAPGQSSDYGYYFCESKEKALAAMSAFSGT